MNLSRYKTEQLLNLLKRARACGGTFFGEGLNDPPGTERAFTVAELKAELAGREHVPSKAERKKLRQEQAQRKKNR